ncbi:MAG: (Fe-S)-binding protein [Chloroflexota bacterium]|nr:(Fe-S)-binding protein [Chloroflexota bacterium]
MPLPIGPVLGILSDNLTQRGSVIPLSKKSISGWSKGLNIPRGGETILYTGLMYQLLPFIDTMAMQMSLFENSIITNFFGLGRIVNKFINLSFFMSLLASKEMKRENNQVLRNIARILQNAGVEFGYLYDQEFYSGALVYDEGLDESFAAHAQRVFEVFRKNGVRRVITVDPHTTNILRDVYPKFIADFDIEVQSYLEVLADKQLPVVQAQYQEVVIHDSCVYARYEDIIEQPRSLLTNAEVTVKEPELHGKATHCCGGPIESLFPSKSREIAHERIDQLTAEGSHIVTMCPICQVSLSNVAGEGCQVEDISNILAEAYLPPTSSTDSRVAPRYYLLALWQFAGEFMARKTDS